MREPERMPRRFSIPPSSASDIQLAQQQMRLAGTSEDLHAWSIYRQVPDCDNSYMKSPEALVQLVNSNQVLGRVEQG